MPLDRERLQRYQIPQTQMSLTRRDTILYALGVGFGANPTDPDALRFTYERNLIACPSMATILAAPHAWIRKADLGFYGASVHAGIGFTLFRPLPVEGAFRSENTVADIVDKGKGRHALITTRRLVFEQGTTDPLFQILSTSMLLNEGGFGGPSMSVAQGTTDRPDRCPDLVVDTPTLMQQALIYRLSGDYNPLHVDPETALKSGFDRPILHGLCTYGIACRLLVAALCPDTPEKLMAMNARFSKPVYPGDQLRLEIWAGENGNWHFRCLVPERGGQVVLDHGVARLQG